MTREVSTTTSSGDDLDQLLGAFFRSELPDPWPGFQPSLSRTLAVTPRPPSLSEPALEPAPLVLPSTARALAHGLWLSRLALAASLALLVAGLWLLGGLALPGDGSLPALRPGSATHQELPIPIESVPDPGPEKLPAAISLEQGPDGRTGLRINLSGELPPNR
jgi:hypothetical protein